MTKEKPANSSYLFNVDILIEDESNARALESLLRILNQSGAADFRIQSGIELGRVIESMITQANPTQDQCVPHLNLVPPREQTSRSSDTGMSDSKRTRPVPPATSTTMAVDERIRTYIDQNKLIRLHVNKGLGVKLSIPCRIVKFDEMIGNVTVYHVDEKQVYTFSINEIDDFIG